MNYQLYKFRFMGGVHFGNGSLDSALDTFYADTLFSALCQQAVKMGESTLRELVQSVQEGSLLLSDAFPFAGKEYFLPKPILHIELGENAGNSVVKKAYKKLKYIPLSCFDNYLRGISTPELVKDVQSMGEYQMTTHAAIRGEAEPRPYRVETYHYYEGNGLYIICGFQSDSQKELFNELMEYLMMDGIGGKRSSGLGRFECYSAKMNEALKARLQMNSNMVMTLSVSLPDEQELATVLSGASYLLQKRSGFVASEQYAEEWMRKRDAYVFAAGSCFSKPYGGCILDVSCGGAHPVYRYAKPIFLGVDV